MKIYLNTDWDVQEFHEILEKFLEINTHNDNYIKMPTLNKPELVA